MLELIHLVNAMVLLAVVLRPFIEWVKWIELRREFDREMEARRLRDAAANYHLHFAASNRNAHALPTGITS